jgi:hypothetical protein
LIFLMVKNDVEWWGMMWAGVMKMMMGKMKQST